MRQVHFRKMLSVLIHATLGFCASTDCHRGAGVCELQACLLARSFIHVEEKVMSNLLVAVTVSSDVIVVELK